MSESESPWSAAAPAKKAGNRTLWWILGGAGCVVLGLITLGILATIVMPNVFRRLGKSQQVKVRVDLVLLGTALEKYRMEHDGAYPRSLHELVTAGGAYEKQGLPRDPWNREYVMLGEEDPRTRPRLFTNGRDGVPGGTGEVADSEYEPR